LGEGGSKGQKPKRQCDGAWKSHYQRGDKQEGKSEKPTQSMERKKKTKLPNTLESVVLTDSRVVQREYKDREKARKVTTRRGSGERGREATLYNDEGYICTTNGTRAKNDKKEGLLLRRNTKKKSKGIAGIKNTIRGGGIQSTVRIHQGRKKKKQKTRQTVGGEGGDNRQVQG